MSISKILLALSLTLVWLPDISLAQQFNDTDDPIDTSLPKGSRDSLLDASQSTVAENNAAPTASSLPLWELGVIGLGVSQQAYPGSDNQVNRLLFVPSFIYRGKFFRSDRETAGFRAINTPKFELDVGVAASFGSKSDDITARKGMPNIGILVEAGPRLKWNLGSAVGGKWRLDLPVRGVFDLNDRGGYRGVAVEPAIVYSGNINNNWSYSGSLGAILGDKKLVSTLYGVDQQFALASRPAFDARSGLIATRLTASVSGRLSRDWRVFGFARLSSVAGAANEESPLVRKTNGASVGIGLSYTWLRSSEKAND
jgi:MipA family protein